MTEASTYDLIRTGLHDGVVLRQEVADHGVEAVVEVAMVLVERLKTGKRVLLCGNGGSASDAQHIAAELVGLFNEGARRPLPAIAIVSNTSTVTAVANDLGFDEVFARQVEALGCPGDLLIALSTSGRSPNLVKAALKASERQMMVIAMTGPEPNELGAIADLVISAPGRSPARIQELHITIGHLLCAVIDAEFAP